MRQERTSRSRGFRNRRGLPSPGFAARVLNVSRAAPMTRVAASGLSWAMKRQMPHNSSSTQGSRIYSGIRAGFLYPCAESAKHGLTINAFATVKAFDALQQSRFQFFKRLGRLGQTHGVVFLETAQTGADDFAGG